MRDNSEQEAGPATEPGETPTGARALIGSLRAHRIDEDRMGQRRQLGRSLQSVRERLTSASGLERSFDVELLRQLAGSLAGASVLSMVALIVTVAAIAQLWVPVQVVAVWAALALMVTGVGQVLGRRTLKAAQLDVAGGRRLLVLVIAAQSLVWAGLVLMFLGVSEPGSKVFLVAALMFYGTLIVMGAHTAPLAVYVSVMPLATALVCFLWGERDIGTVTIAGVGLAGQLFFLFLANRLYQQAVATLEFRAEKDILIAELETAKINSEEARRKAEEANLAKSKFLATMSHELRTPLNAILGFSEVMKNEVFGPHASPSYKEYADDIHTSGSHLLNLINEILDLSRIEAGRYELKEEAVNLAHLVDDCCHMLTLRARSKNQTLRQAVEPNLPRIWGDERAIRQIILNLLTNAVKFTPQGGDILVKVGWTANGGQYVNVTDNGPGIPENELQTVLSSFGRGSQAIKTAEEGSGLGLPIVKGLVEMHGGAFSLKSKLRVGTEVMFTLPAERVMDTLPALPESSMRAA